MKKITQKDIEAAYQRGIDDGVQAALEFVLDGKVEVLRDSEKGETLIKLPDGKVIGVRLGADARH